MGAVPSTPLLHGVYYTGFMLNLENLENMAVFERQGKPGIVREFSITLIQVKENKLLSLHITFISSCMAVHKVVVPFVSVNVNLSLNIVI